MKRKRNLTRQEIIRVLETHQGALKKYKVKKIGLFGSYAAGRQRQRSDIDFIVEFSEPSYDNFIDLVNYLEKIFGKKIDILTREGVEGIRVESVANDIKRSVIYV